MPNFNYSLWLMPEGELQTTLAALIDSIARQHTAPAFPAHITLLGNVHGNEQEILANTQKLAQSNKAFPVTLSELDITPEFYRALFIRVALSSALAHLYEQGKHIFQFRPKTEYRPHLSLLYSDLTQVQKDRIIASIQPQLQDLPHTFPIDKLYLYNTDGPTETWQQVAAFSLNV